jgi:site-specific recombinase XerD
MKELIQTGSRNLTKAEFHHLADVPPETEWFANIQNANTRRAYRKDVTEFASFLSLARSDEFRQVTRAHVIAWRKEMESRELAG